MRVVHVLNQIDVGGTEKTAQIFCRLLPKFGCIEPYMYSLDGGWRVWPIKSEKTPLTVGTAENLYGYMMNHDIDMIHLHRAGWAEDGVMKSIMQAFTEMEKPIYIFETNVFGDGDRGPYGKFINRHLFVSNYTKEIYNRGTFSDLRTPQEKLQVLYNPIDLPDGEEKKRRRDFRAELDIPQDAFVCGRIGRSANYHGISMMALKKLWDEKRDVYFVAVLPDRAMIKELNKVTHDCVRIIDEPLIYQDQISLFYFGIDVLLHDRVDGETFGCSIAEAMVHGRPIVSHISKKYQGHLETMLMNSNAALQVIGLGPRDIKFKDGRVKMCASGFITGVDDYEAYADCIMQASTHRAMYSQKVADAARVRFSSEMIAETLAWHYDDVTRLGHHQYKRGM